MIVLIWLLWCLSNTSSNLFHSLLSECGGEFHASESGQLKSPNYPNTYNEIQDCIWVITVSAGSTVTLDFETPFEVSYT